MKIQIQKSRQYDLVTLFISIYSIICIMQYINFRKRIGENVTTTTHPPTCLKFNANNSVNFHRIGGLKFSLTKKWQQNILLSTVYMSGLAFRGPELDFNYSLHTKAPYIFSDFGRGPWNEVLSSKGRVFGNILQRKWRGMWFSFLIIKIACTL